MALPALMAAIKPNNPDMNEPTGSFEELFRHHMADAEVPVRPMLWEQVDNSLLVRQNEVYRKRLAATRWVAAASLLLASLAGGGWWAAQQPSGTADVATVPNGRAATSESNAAGLSSGLGGNDGVATAASPAASPIGQPAGSQGGMAQVPAQAGTPDKGTAAAAGAEVGAVANGYQAVANARRAKDATTAANARANRAALPSAIADRALGRSAAGVGAPIAVAGVAAAGRTVGLGRSQAGRVDWLGAQGRSLTTGKGASALAGGNSNTGDRYAPMATLVGTAGATTAAGTFVTATGLAATSAEAEATSLAGLTSLAGRSSSLHLMATQSLPTGLSPVPVTAAPVPAPLPKWQFGASYAVSAFNPNINFSRQGSTDYIYNMSPVLGDNTVALSEAAAAEYRQHLQAGLGQRLALRAARRLGNGRWSLATGVELAQNQARSATSGFYVGEQVPDLGQPISPIGGVAANGAGELRGTTFRYRSAGVPVELSYANPIRRGWSTYGRVGAVVSALFNVRAEVAGVPEAGRTYSLMSAGGAYRKVVATVRGGAGVQFRPVAGSYTLSLGPVAEAGLLSLNAHPSEDFLQQNRPYSLGVEAGVAFGK